MELNTIKKMERFARQDSEVISLGQGIPALPVHPHIKAQIVKAVHSGVADQYSDPQGIPELRRAIAARLVHEGMRYSPEEIIMTAGAIEALGVAVRSVVNERRKKVIVPTPVYSAYFKLVEVAGGETIEVPLDEKNAWRPDADEIVNEIDETTAAVLLCNPNNPTGTVYSRKDLERICVEAQQKGVCVIVDEVYRNMVYDQKPFYSPATDPRFKDTVIRVMSFSKDFSLTGWRVGYLHASIARIPRLLGIHDTLINCTPVISQYAALAALEVYDEIVAQNLTQYEKQRQFMASGMKKLSDMLDFVMPAGAYFFFPRIVSGSPSQQTALEILEKSGVVTVPGNSFGMGGEGHLRLCFGRDEASIEKAIVRLVASLKGVQ